MLDLVYRISHNHVVDFMIISSLTHIDFLTAEVVIDNKGKQQDAASGDLLTDKLSLVRIQLHNQQNVNSEQATDHQSETPLGKTNIVLCIIVYSYGCLKYVL